ncbi:hypothetical protein QFZ99_000139 [Paraburkholderia atlantica]
MLYTQVTVVNNHGNAHQGRMTGEYLLHTNRYCPWGPRRWATEASVTTSEPGVTRKSVNAGAAVWPTRSLFHRERDRAERTLDGRSVRSVHRHHLKHVAVARTAGAL